MSTETDEDQLLFVEGMRRYIASLPEQQVGWLAGLRDRHVAWRRKGARIARTA